MKKVITLNWDISLVSPGEMVVGLVKSESESKIGCLTWRIDGRFGETIISAGQSEFTLKNILQCQAGKRWFKWSEEDCILIDQKVYVKYILIVC